MRKLDNSELDRKSVSDFKAAAKTPIIIILDDVRSLHNIGSVFRTSDAFLIQKIYLCGITAIPPHKEIHKTALGATETVDWEYSASAVEAVKKLQTEGVEVYAVEQVEQSVLLQNFHVNTGSIYALVFGNEVYGVNEDVVSNCKGTIEIPQSGTKHSLNVSVSAGIVVWDLYSKLMGL